MGVFVSWVISVETGQFFKILGKVSAVEKIRSFSSKLGFLFFAIFTHKIEDFIRKHKPKTDKQPTFAVHPPSKQVPSSIIGEPPRLRFLKDRVDKNHGNISLPGNCRRAKTS